MRTCMCECVCVRVCECVDEGESVTETAESGSCSIQAKKEKKKSKKRKQNVAICFEPENLRSPPKAVSMGLAMLNDYRDTQLALRRRCNLRRCVSRAPACPPPLCYGLRALYL